MKPGLRFFEHLILVPLLSSASLTSCSDDTIPMTKDKATADLALSAMPVLAMDAALPPAGIKYLDVSNLTDMTPDGRLTLLQDMESAEGNVYVYDAYLDKLEFRGSAANPDPAMGDTTKGRPNPPQGVFGISADGRRIVGTQGAPLQAAFLASDGWHPLGQYTTPICPPSDPANISDLGSAGSGWDISDDGRTIVGLAWSTCAETRAVRWTETDAGQGTFTELQFMGRKYSRATKVSADGTIVGGFFQASAARSPAIWRADGTIIALDPTGMVVGEVFALSADGKIATGNWNDTDGNHGYYWTEAGGVKMLPPLADASPFDKVWPNAIAAEGQLIFGSSGDWTGLGNVPRAFVWTAQDNKIQLLQDVVAKQGITLPANLTFSTVYGASPDGSVIVGQTLESDPNRPSRKQRSFWMRLPNPLVAVDAGTGTGDSGRSDSDGAPDGSGMGGAAGTGPTGGAAGGTGSGKAGNAGTSNGDPSTGGCDCHLAGSRRSAHGLVAAALLGTLLRWRRQRVREKQKGSLVLDPGSR